MYSAILTKITKLPDYSVIFPAYNRDETACNTHITAVKIHTAPVWVMFLLQLKISWTPSNITYSLKTLINVINLKRRCFYITSLFLLLMTLFKSSISYVLYQQVLNNFTDRLTTSWHLLQLPWPTNNPPAAAAVRADCHCCTMTEAVL